MDRRVSSSSSNHRQHPSPRSRSAFLPSLSFAPSPELRGRVQPPIRLCPRQNGSFEFFSRPFDSPVFYCPIRTLPVPAISVCHGCLHLSSTPAAPPSGAVSVERLPSGSLCLPSSLSHPRGQQIRAFVPAGVPSRPPSSVRRATCLRLILRSYSTASLLFRAFHPLSVLSFSGAQAPLVAISPSFSCNTHVHAHLHEPARYLDTYTQTARKPLARRSNNLRSSLGARYGGISGRERSLFSNVSLKLFPELPCRSRFR